MPFRFPISDWVATKKHHDAVSRVLRRGRLTEGEETELFEREFAKFLGAEHCVAFSSGTTALLGGLLAARTTGHISAGPIITNPVTYPGTVNCLKFAGLEPVFVDLAAGSFSMDPAAARVCVTDAARVEPVAAILPVHLFGSAERMTNLRDLAQDAGTPIIEDAAQAHGSVVDGLHLGRWGLFGAFSFHMSHAIQAGEMGAVITSDRRLANRLVEIKHQGRKAISECTFEERFTVYTSGLNMRPTELTAAIARCSLQDFDSNAGRRRKVAQQLMVGLSGVEDLLESFRFSQDTVPFAFPLVIKAPGIRRLDFLQELEKAGLETRPMFPCIPLAQPAFAHLRCDYQDTLPHAQYVSKRGLYIGCHHHLTEEDARDMAMILVQTVQKLALASSGRAHPRSQA